MSDNTDNYKYPIIMGEPIKREEIITFLWSGYEAMLELAKKSNPNIVRFPDAEDLIEHIDEYGLPPKSKPTN